MPTSSKKLLLVEGENDRLFYQICCDRFAKLRDIEVGPPSRYMHWKDGEKPDGKNNAIDLFLTEVSRLAQDVGRSHLALVVDADSPATDGLGFRKTWEKITPTLEKAGYTIPPYPNKSNSGTIFQHNDGLPAIGLWVMPDNFNKGFLEDFVKKTLKAEEKSLFSHAATTVSALQNPKFKQHHLSKAEVATYMAWQETPGQGLHGALGAKLLQFDKGVGNNFIVWLQQCFR
ncbi:MAG: hypothetical protein HYZ45_08420 [Burkholderiales bacterium]|nr:hypothetical protein [Burkholderiales bacterium]